MDPVLPLNCGSPSALAPQPRDWDVLLTAETHNFPCAVAPYPGQREKPLRSAAQMVPGLLWSPSKVITAVPVSLRMAWGGISTMPP